MLVDTLEVFGLPDNWDKVAKHYLEAFEDVPLDLVQAALKDVRLTFKFPFPKPADLREPIRQALSERLGTLVRLQGVLDVGRFEGDD